MDVYTARVLEFERLKDFLLSFVKTSLGTKRLRDLFPARGKDEVEARLTLCREFLEAQSQGFRLPPAGEAPDLPPVLGRVGLEGVRLTGKELYSVLWLCDFASALRSSLEDRADEWPHFRALLASLPSLDDLKYVISRSIDPTGLLRDDASAAIFEIRSRLRDLRERIHRVLEGIMASSPAIQEEIVVQREDRYVLTVRAGSQSMIPGVIHGQSSSGASVFVEPLVSIELNNHLRLLLDEEQEETDRILLELTSKVHAGIADLSNAADIIGYVDLLSALGTFATRTRSVVPSLNDAGRLFLRDARHPLLCLEVGLRAGRPDREVVPATVELDNDTRMLVVSGPNSGGKTVLLKTVGLIGMMVQSGMPVPVHPDSTLPVFRTISADIGDQQDLSAHLSTFAAHLKTIQKIIEEHEEPAMVLLDELGGSTDPEEGGALGMAVAEFFLHRDVRTVITTHGEPLKVFAARTPGVRNAAMEFDGGPTYRMLPGIPGSSNALKIASGLAFPGFILDRAREIHGETHLMVGRYLEELQHKLAEIERERSLLTSLTRQAEEERRGLVQDRRALEADRMSMLGRVYDDKERAIREIFGATAGRIDEILDGLTSKAEIARLKGLARKRLTELHREASDNLSRQIPEVARPAVPSMADPARAPQAGSRIRLKKLGIVGIAAGGSNRDGTIEVLVSGKKIAVPPDEVEVVDGGPVLPPRVSLTYDRASKETLPMEINLIGLRVEEAVERADKFLDDAMLGCIPQVRIVHGHGTGRLRKALREWLKGHRGVRDFREGEPAEGGNGATVVALDV